MKVNDATGILAAERDRRLALAESFQRLGGVPELPALAAVLEELAPAYRGASRPALEGFQQARSLELAEQQVRMERVLRLVWAVTELSSRAMEAGRNLDAILDPTRTPEESLAARWRQEDRRRHGTAAALEERGWRVAMALVLALSLGAAALAFHPMTGPWVAGHPVLGSLVPFEVYSLGWKVDCTDACIFLYAVAFPLALLPGLILLLRWLDLRFEHRLSTVRTARLLDDLRRTRSERAALAQLDASTLESLRRTVAAVTDPGVSAAWLELRRNFADIVDAGSGLADVFGRMAAAERELAADLERGRHGAGT